MKPYPFYPYHNEQGKEIYRIVRLPEKNFRIQHSENGEWVYGRGGEGLVPYRLLEVLEAVRLQKDIYVVEGEKDVNTMRRNGFVATCNPFGAGKWKKEFAQYLKGAKRVIILPDCDPPGINHAFDVAEKLKDVVPEIKIIELPESDLKWDITDWLEAGHSISELKNLIVEAAPWNPAKNERPSIVVEEGHLPRIATEVWQAIQNANDEAPSLFLYGGMPIRLKKNGNDRISIEPLNEAKLKYYLVRLIAWKKMRNGVFCLTEPTSNVLRDILATPVEFMKLPVLERIVQTPVYTQNGMLISKEGYDVESKIYFKPRKGFVLPEVPSTPSRSDIQKAKDYILEELLVDFPFTEPADWAHCVALLLLPFVRMLIQGPTPLHLIQKPTRGTGGTLLAQTIALVGIGERYHNIHYGNGGDELRKVITATLRELPEFVVMDNVSSRISSPELASALTDDVWKDRILGLSENIQMKVLCAWAATANNPTLSMEVARRTVNIRIDAKISKPWTDGVRHFKHPYLTEWVSENRAALVWSCCVLVQNWIAKGMPEGKRSLGMFESWAKTLGGILETAGINGFLDNAHKFYDEADEEEQIIYEFIQKWHDCYHDREVTTDELYRNALFADVGLDLGGGTERSKRIKFSKEILKIKDQIIGLIQSDGSTLSVFIKAMGKRKNARLWKLVANEPAKEGPLETKVRVVKKINVLKAYKKPMP